jgi:hypothetical protein
MYHNIVIELDEDGFVVGVYCPLDNCKVEILDRADKSPLPEVRDYYYALEKEIKNMHNCLDN